MFDHLGRAELRLLRRLVINPSLKQAALAKELGISRSAVNQLWRKLESERSLSVRSAFDYPKLGLDFVFGWANDKEGSKTIVKFSRWLSANPYVSLVISSRISSMMDQRVYFEALIPAGQRRALFYDQLNRFRLRPYNLSLNYGSATHLACHMNLGLLDGRRWEVLDGFRFATTIESARGYVDVLPKVPSIEQTGMAKLNLERLAIAAVIEKNYYATTSELERMLNDLNLTPLSERTTRRRLASTRREGVIPYVDVRNIGLNQRVMICLEEGPDESGLSRLLQTQATTLPSARVVHNKASTAIILDLPESASWFALSKVLSEQAGAHSLMCTFIAEDSQLWKGLASLAVHEVSRVEK